MISMPSSKSSTKTCTHHNRQINKSLLMTKYLITKKTKTLQMCIIQETSYIKAEGFTTLQY